MSATRGRLAVIHSHCGQLDDPARGQRCPCHNPAHAAQIRSDARQRILRARRTAQRFTAPQRAAQAREPRTPATATPPVGTPRRGWAGRTAPVDPTGKAWAR